jgi:N-acetylglucosamine-6-phosphate deacetylase
MSMLTKRGPWRQLGLLEAALASDDLTAEVIADGFHVPAELVRIAHRCLGIDRMCLISDASAGTGLPLGCCFRMGSAEGRVESGVALTLDGSAFCGSTSSLASIFRFCVTRAGLSVVDCARMAATTPARLLGLEAQTGRIAEGLRADLVVLDDEMEAQAVMRAGRWIKFWGEP